MSNTVDNRSLCMPVGTSGHSKQHFYSLVHVLLLVTIFISDNLKCGAPMDKNFCDAVAAKNEPVLRKLIDGFVTKLDTKGNEENNFRQIKSWLEAHECIDSVSLGYGMLRSEPPIKEFHVKLVNDKASARTLTIGIQCFPDKLKFHSIN